MTELTSSQIMSNSFRIVAPSFDPIGLALDPLVSRANHSCVPNAIIVFDGPKLQIRALRRFKAGDEVLISYVDQNNLFSRRQEELQRDYGFKCRCPKCETRDTAPQERPLTFKESVKTSLKPGKGISMELPSPESAVDTLGTQISEAFDLSQRLDREAAVDHLQRALKLAQDSRVWPITRAPLPAVYQAYFDACLTTGHHERALLAGLRRYCLIDPVLYPQSIHPVRVVHAWSLFSLLKAYDWGAVGSAIARYCGQEINLSPAAAALLTEIHEHVPLSHGAESTFAKLIESMWRELQQELHVAAVLDCQSVDTYRRVAKMTIDRDWQRVKSWAEDPTFQRLVEAA